MGNDSVMACILNTTSNTVADIKMYWNTPDQNSLPLQVGIFTFKLLILSTYVVYLRISMTL